MKILKGLMYVFDGKGQCYCEWSWHLPEWVMAMLLYVFCWETFKARTETVKWTYWLQPPTLCTLRLPIFHLSETWKSAVVAELVAAALLWQTWVTLAMCACTRQAAQGRWTRTDWQSNRGWGDRERWRERRQPRVNLVPWTATIRHLSGQHLFAFISRRWITYNQQSQCWISTLVLKCHYNRNAFTSSLLVTCWFLFPFQ